MNTSSTSIASIAERFTAVAPACDHWSIRVVRQRSEHLSVTRGVPDPVHVGDDIGVMVTVVKDGGLGYGATSDITSLGLVRAGREACDWANRVAGRMVAVPPTPHQSAVRFDHEVRPARPWSSVSRADKMARLGVLAAGLTGNERIVNWQAGLSFTDEEVVIATSEGGFIRQRYGLIVPDLEASASAESETQTRTFGRGGTIRQGGLEALDDLGFWNAGPRIAGEALELLAAPDCPTGVMDLLLSPDQMYIQIHESIGHPLELDRILGDERNYAGTSFVSLDMFGGYVYGSSLLNVTFDPGVSGEAASYAFDDDGTRASREHLIRDGILVRPLGGAFSQARANVSGVSNARACSWNRPTIDRMANLNVEPGGSRLEDLVAQVENGVLMETNTSWSIDDSRNKFQFGCERGRLIRDGVLGPVVKNPNYRGISATFWRSLKGLGDAASLRVHGTPTCGKGEPNQAIHVGHATPPGLFADVQVFGGG
ncbi:MAG: TldD/PmbA family protein [Rhodospirillaceae bacterium]|nr:MAG: TldD/PmbA family protein [Rhodospirillaceae bacterium]